MSTLPSHSGSKSTPSSARALGFAVVGVGYWGPNIVRVLRELPDADLRVACDIDPQALETIGRRYPLVELTSSLDDILADETVDAVVIATPVSTHFQLAARALRAGKHVFIEKPLTRTSADGVELRRLAEERELMLMPGHTFVYSPPVNMIRDLISSGELGDVYFISMSRVNLGLHQPDVSVAWDLGPHDFSILRYWLDEMPTTISALSRGCIIPDLPDVAFINVEFPSKTVAHIELSWLAPSKLRRTAVVGSKKMIVYDDTSNEPVRIYDSGVIPPNPETFAEYRLTYRSGDVISPQVSGSEPLMLEMADFCEAIRTGRPPRSDTALGLDVVTMCEAVDGSLAAGGAPVRLDGYRIDG